MAGKLGKFQMVAGEHWMGLTKENHLGSWLQSNQTSGSRLMVELLAAKTRRTIDTYLSKLPVAKFDNDNEYYWDVVGSASRNIPLIEARDEFGNVITKNDADSSNMKMVGAGTAPFYLVFGEVWFADGEYIVGNLNEAYQFRILGDAKLEGTHAVYKVELAGGNVDGVPAERLLSGERFSIEAAFIEKELSRKVGDVRFATPVSMRNEWSRIRIQHKVPGTMLNKKLAVGIPLLKKTPTGYQRAVENMWMLQVDWTVEQQFNDYKNNALLFGRSNRNINGEYTNIGKSGEAIKTGMGLMEQIEMGNTQYYNRFSLKLLENALYELSAAKLEFGERKFIIRTGERGAIQFHKAVLDTVSGWTQFTYNGDTLGVVKKTNASFTGATQALAAGYQFTEYMAPNGVHVSLDIDPMYDNLERNKIMHPNGGVAMSYRYDIMYAGTEEHPNIQKCELNGQSEFRGYEWGPFANPFTGQTDNLFASYDEDSAVIHKKTTLGVVVYDPTRIISLIPAILAY